MRDPKLLCDNADMMLATRARLEILKASHMFTQTRTSRYNASFRGSNADTDQDPGHVVQRLHPEVSRVSVQMVWSMMALVLLMGRKE